MIYDLGVLALAGGLSALALWGRRHIEQLVSPTVAPPLRRRMLGQYRRGALGCQIIAVLMVIYAVARLRAGA